MRCETDTALRIVSSLAEGHDPGTGEALPRDHVFQQPDVIRAMAMAVSALQGYARRQPWNARMPSRVGLTWTESEEQHLLLAFDAGATIAALAARHERTTVAIVSRLVKLGRPVPRFPDDDHGLLDVSPVGRAEREADESPDRISCLHHDITAARIRAQTALGTLLRSQPSSDELPALQEELHVLSRDPGPDAHPDDLQDRLDALERLDDRLHDLVIGLGDPRDQGPSTTIPGTCRSAQD